MRNGFVYVAAAVAILLSARGVQAQSPVYSFEDAGIDGFFGLGAAVLQEPTIGVTHGDSSLKYAAGNDGFVGARTETVIPANLNDPPGVSHVLFDMTIVDAYAGTFADIGITVFGHDLNPIGGTSFGNQVQFADTQSIAALGVGTHTDLRLDLDFSQGPYRFGESFNDIFGSGPNDLSVATAFQFYISKNTQVPVTVYIDNVRLVVPEPATLSLLGLAVVGLGVIARRKR
ncbi:MAG: PEP-CTERM sorting domain-containing protein [Pirellulales bacterium]